MASEEKNAFGHGAFEHGTFEHYYAPGRTGLTLLLLHGTGGDENDLVPVGRGLAPGAALLSPRGKVSDQGMLRFFSRPGPTGFDQLEIRQRAEELAAWVGWAAGHYGFDAGRIHALGYSNGANMAGALMLVAPDLLAGACLLRARSVLKSPEAIELSGKSVLIAAGQSDALIPVEGARELAETLRDAGASVDLVVQNAGHELTPADFNLGKQWFARMLA
jgi:phospholipase/carboxylesterase